MNALSSRPRAWKRRAWKRSRSRSSAGLASLLLFAAACSSSEPLEITTRALPEVRVGSPVNAQIEARGGKPPYSYRATALQDGLSLSLNGLVSGTAKLPGRHKLSVKVYDLEGAAAEQAIDFRVLPEPLTVSTSALPDAQQGLDYDQALAVSGGVAPFRWALASGALPPGMELTPEGRVRGTPTQPGTFEFTPRVEDGEGETRTGLVRLIVVSLDPEIVAESMPAGRVGERYEAALHVEGGLAPFVFAVTRGNLPPGVSLSSTGMLSGSPTQAGEFAATVRVSDGANPPRTDTAEVMVTIVPALRIRTTQLPPVVVGLTYDFTMDAVGGVPPYTWSLTGDEPPAGITFDASGRFSGTTSAMREEARFTLRVTDAQGFDEASIFTLRTTDSYVFEVQPPDLAVPRICTSTSVAYTVVEIPVLDSFQVSDVNVAVDIDYRWNESASVFRRGNNRSPGSPRIVLFAPDGTQAPLCGNGASIPAGEECSNSTQDLRKEYDDEATAAGNRPERPLSAFDGMNAQGTWRLAVAVTEPTCSTPGRVNSVRLTIEDDRSTANYLRVTGYRRNNMATDPFVRICTPRCGGVIESELFLRGTVYSVGPNGRREGGAGDDVAQNVPLTWSWEGGTALPGITLESNGHVLVRDSGIRRCTGAGACYGTGQRRILVSGGGFMASMTLLVFPPEWNNEVREY